MTHSIPLSLYIHIPWCIKKCPYCDFNSHAVKNEIPEFQYINQLLLDLENDLHLVAGREIKSIFIGGGTPSLFSATSLEKLLSELKVKLNFSQTIEITLEANPGTFETQRFKDFYAIGINRLSIGIQSFQNEKLKLLGRIHDAEQSKQAVEIAQQAGFNNINLDLMFGLPEQTLKDAMLDLNTAIQFQTSHLSWYQLTLEPNTYFYSHPPTLPIEEAIWKMQLSGQDLLAKNNYLQYEVSAYSKYNLQCSHNLNYWQFGDYLGIGAGAHSKMTFNNQIIRKIKIKHPNAYLLAKNNFIAEEKIVPEKEIPFEFMLNALRLNQVIPVQLFTERTGLQSQKLESMLIAAANKKLISYNKNTIITTSLGKRFLNDLVQLFL